ncbi:hypothetical protein BX666DRAFT_1952574 [Dichotomocladium elegans]|nr:hypothetical protein BX666DRAFT_1952574 [Dichotomocladium elegans]
MTPIYCSSSANPTATTLLSPPAIINALTTDTKQHNNVLNNTTTHSHHERHIPQFFFPFGKPESTHLLEQRRRKIVSFARQLFDSHAFLLETQFVAITQACDLPRYMNLALFRRIDSMYNRDEKVTFEQFTSGWADLSRQRYDDESIFFNILRKPDCPWLLPEDFLPVLEDIVLHHPGLRFLNDNAMFQERYIETVICRLYYEARCPSGKMTFQQFRRCGFAKMIRALGPTVDLNLTRDCFSYKHFYVLYCKFWTLDDDHDLIISETNLAKYNQAALNSRVVERIIQSGTIPAFSRDGFTDTHSLSYLDYIWFLLSEVDKSTPIAIEYWFRCLDTDGDGVLSGYELEQFWKEQESRQQYYGGGEDDHVPFQNILCQMNDLIRPHTPGQFKLGDLKKNGYLAERFFDTFINFERFQVHESYQGSIRAKREQELAKLRQQHQQMDGEDAVFFLDESLGYSMISDWCDYAEIEYQQLLVNEGYDASWDDDEEGNDDVADNEEDYEASIDEEAIYEEEEEDDNDDELEHAFAAAAAAAAATAAETDEDDDEELDDEVIHNETNSTTSTSDQDSDTSAPATPTKEPIAADNLNGNIKTNSCGSHPHQPQQSWLWQPRHHHIEEDSTNNRQICRENDEGGGEQEDKAIDWIWWITRQRQQQSSNLN